MSVEISACVPERQVDVDRRPPSDAVADRHRSTLAAWLFATTGEVVTEVT